MACHRAAALPGSPSRRTRSSHAADSLPDRSHAQLRSERSRGPAPAGHGDVGVDGAVGRGHPAAVRAVPGDGLRQPRARRQRPRRGRDLGRLHGRGRPCLARGARRAPGARHGVVARVGHRAGDGTGSSRAGGEHDHVRHLGPVRRLPAIRDHGAAAALRRPRHGGRAHRRRHRLLAPAGRQPRPRADDGGDAAGVPRRTRSRCRSPSSSGTPTWRTTPSTG